jgi:large subunit ribosomal protein L25
VPGVVYGRGRDAVAVDLDGSEFSLGVKGISESTIVKIDIDGEDGKKSSVNAFVKDTQRNILDGQFLHVDFYEVESGVELRARVPLVIQGSAVGVRDGGILETPLRDIEVECLPKDLPERLIVDISTLGLNQSIHVRDLPLAEGVKLISAADQVVALVKFAREAEAASAGEEAAAAPAADAAAPAKE